VADRLLEFQPHRFLQHLEEPFLLLDLGRADAFAPMAADRTQKMGLTAFASHDVHAGIAHDFMAVRAFEGGRHLRVARAKHRSIVEHHRGLRDFRDRDVGDENFRIDGFHEKFHIAQFQFLSLQQPRFFDGITIEESSIGRTAIAEIDAVILQGELAMNRRNRRVIDVQLTIGVASHPVNSEAQLQCLISQPLGFYQKPRHINSLCFEIKRT
jgi:hypothetical protein